MSIFLEKSHPEHAADERKAAEETAAAAENTAAAELVTVASRIQAWQDSRTPRISSEEMLRRFPGLGSTKTYRRVCKGDTTSLVIEAQLARFKAVWYQIQEMSGDIGPEEVYQDLTPAYETARAAALLIPQQGRERLMIIEGPTGSGKTIALQNIAAKYGPQCIYAEAQISWTSPNAMLCDLLVAYGVYSNPNQDAQSDMPIAKGSRLSALQAANREKRRILLIDEGHHMSAEGLNILKGLLNDSDLVIIIACIDTLWSKLASRSWEEAAQLVYNRLFERVRLTPPTPEDAESFLVRRVRDFAAADAWKPALGKICEAARHYGSYSFLRRLAKRMNQTEDHSVGAIIAECEAIKTNLQTRKPKAA